MKPEIIFLIDMFELIYCSKNRSYLLHSNYNNNPALPVTSVDLINSVQILYTMCWPLLTPSRFRYWQYPRLWYSWLLV